MSTRIRGSLIIAFGIALIFCAVGVLLTLHQATPAAAAPANEPPSGTIAWKVLDAGNHISLTVNLEGTYDEWQTFYFGDGDQVDLNFHVVTGTASTDHWYAYNPLGVISYTVAMTVTGPDGSTPISTVVVIDDRPPADPPTGQISWAVTEAPNGVGITVTLEGGYGDWQVLYFGDGTQTGLNFSESAVVTTSHSYTYNLRGVISYTVAMTVTGIGGITPISEVVVIDDRPPYSVYLPIILRLY